MDLRDSMWQSRFYEVRARDQAARANIRRYIRDNPRNYDAVINCGEPQCLGNNALLALPKVALQENHPPMSISSPTDLDRLTTALSSILA